MKFVHIADLHLDSPFTILTEKMNIGEQRRIEQYIALKEVIEYIKEHAIDYLFISGDLYENGYIKKSTIEYMNSLFEEIQNTKIFISPGNHDPYIKGSPYDIFDFSPNVYIFESNSIEKYEDGDVVIYGSAFTGFHRHDNPLEEMDELDSTKTNILLLHCDLNGVKNKNEMGYLPINESKLKSLKFDYCALGHIHKKYINSDSSIVYPGSLISFGFDELGEHGMVVGTIDNHSIRTQFVKVDNREFIELPIDVSDYNGVMQIIESINQQPLIDINLYKIILCGKRNFELDIKTIKNNLEFANILKIEDMTQREYNIEQISKEQSLKGAFIRRVMELNRAGTITQDQMNKMIEIGLEAMN